MATSRHKEGTFERLPCQNPKRLLPQISNHNVSWITQKINNMPNSILMCGYISAQEMSLSKKIGKPNQNPRWPPPYVNQPPLSFEEAVLFCFLYCA